MFNKLGEYFHIPSDLADRKYHGCGSGRVVLSKITREVVGMDYMEDGEVIDVQNIHMCADAGTLLEEDEQVLIYKANFSCGTACLF